MRVILQPGFILHTKYFNETSYVLDMFTKPCGRVSLLAKGVRSHRSRFRGLLRPFVPLLLSWSGKTELMSLSAAEPCGPYFDLKGNALLSGIYINELLARFLPKFDPHPNLFESYQTVLVSLGTSHQETSLRIFERDLLVGLGYGLSLNRDALTEGAIRATQDYVFIPKLGLIRWLPHHAKAFVFKGKNLLAFHEGELREQDDLRAAKQLMRLAIGALLSRPLRSREFFSTMSLVGSSKSELY